MPSIPPDPTRNANQLQLLQMIRIEGLTSRVELAARTGQSRATVTNITARLLDKKLIVEKKTKASGAKGRRRVMLALNPDAAFVVGVKAMRSIVSIAVTDFNAEVRSSLSIPVRADLRPATHLADIIEDGIRHCVKEARLSMEMISGIGLSIPGFVDSVSGHCLWTPLYNMGETSLRRLVQERFNIPTFIENDANAVTLAELWFGEGHGVDNFIVITIEQGVGMGLVVNGQLYRGPKGVGTEFGHVVIDPDGPMCRCGKHGCLEVYAGGQGILGQAQKLVEQGRLQHPNPELLGVEEVIEMARAGNKPLREVFRKGGKILGLGVAGLMQIFNPRKVLLIGEYTSFGDLMFKPMRDEINRRVNNEFQENTEIKVLEWQSSNWARGAASVVLQKLYESPFERIRFAPYMEE